MGTTKKRIAKIERKVERDFLAWSLMALAIALIIGLIILFFKGLIVPAELQSKKDRLGKSSGRVTQPSSLRQA
jgi:hypothetical protein